MGEIKTAEYFVEHMENKYKGALDSLSVDDLSLVVAVIEQDMIRGDKEFVEVDRSGIECRLGELTKLVIPGYEHTDYELGYTLEDFDDEDEYRDRLIETECIRENIYRYILRYIAPKLKENGFGIKVVKVGNAKVELRIDYTRYKDRLERALGKMKFVYKNKPKNEMRTLKSMVIYRALDDIYSSFQLDKKDMHSIDNSDIVRYAKRFRERDLDRTELLDLRIALELELKKFKLRVDKKGNGIEIRNWYNV